MSNHENPETVPEWPVDAVPVQPEPESEPGSEPITAEAGESEPTVVEPTEETVVEPLVADAEIADAEIADAEIADAEIAEAEIAGAEYPDEEVDAQVVDADVVDVAPEPPQPEPPVSTFALGDSEAAPPTGTDFSVDQPAAAAAPPAATPYAPPTAGGSFLDLPPMPDLPFTLPPAPGAPASGQPAPSYPQSSDYPPAQSGSGPYGAPGQYGAPGPYGAPSGPSAPGGGYYGEQSAAQAYGHGARPAASYEQPAPAPQYPQSAPNASYGAPAGYGMAPYQTSGNDTMMASMAHWLPLVVSAVTGGTLGFLAPLIIMQTKGQQDPFVRANATESLNFNLTVLIGMIVSFVLMFVAVGLIGVVVIPIVAIILQILGAMAANRGEVYRYPISIRFVK